MNENFSFDDKINFEFNSLFTENLATHVLSYVLVFLFIIIINIIIERKRQVNA